MAQTTNTTVTVYGKPNCVQCDRTTAKLAKARITVTYIDVTENQAAFDRVVAMGFQQVPVVVTDTDRWSGYRPDKIAAITR